jgi:AbrB family looped-hinge helix DNA binding protein
MVSTVSSKGQITIPADVRRHLGVVAADKIAFLVLDGGRVELRPVRYTVAGLRGIVPALPGREAEDFEDQIAEALEEGADRTVREIEHQ